MDSIFNMDDSSQASTSGAQTANKDRVQKIILEGRNTAPAAHKALRARKKQSCPATSLESSDNRVEADHSWQLSAKKSRLASSLESGMEGEAGASCSQLPSAEPGPTVRGGKPGKAVTHDAKNESARGVESNACNITEINRKLDSLMRFIPVITEMKEAYDSYMESGSVDVEETATGDSDEEIESAQMQYFQDVAGTSVSAGPTINEKIARGVTKVLEEGMSKETVEKTTEKYQIPENCPRLEAITCNPEIYKNASNRARIRDVSLQNVQKVLSKATTAITMAFDKLSQQGDSSVIECVADGVAMMSHASHSLDILRRQCFKGELKEEYNSLCSPKYPVSGSLFGENVNERIKEVNETMRVAKCTRRFQPYKNRRFPFLGQGQPWKPKGGGNNNDPHRRQWQQQTRPRPHQQKRSFANKRRP